MGSLSNVRWTLVCMLMPGHDGVKSRDLLMVLSQYDSIYCWRVLQSTNKELISIPASASMTCINLFL